VAQSWLSKRNNVTENKNPIGRREKTSSQQKPCVPPACIFKFRTKIEQKCKICGYSVGYISLFISNINILKRLHFPMKKRVKPIDGHKIPCYPIISQFRICCGSRPSPRSKPDKPDQDWDLFTGHLWRIGETRAVLATKARIGRHGT